MVKLWQRTRGRNNKKRLYELVFHPIFLHIYNHFCVLSVSTIRNCASLRGNVFETATLDLRYSTYTWNVWKIEKFFDATTATLAYKPRVAISGKQLRIIETDQTEIDRTEHAFAWTSFVAFVPAVHSWDESLETLPYTLYISSENLSRSRLTVTLINIDKIFPKTMFDTCCILETAVHVAY